MEVRQGCGTVIIILLFPDTPTIERAACSQARSPFHLFFPIQQLCIADLQDMGNGFQFNVRNKPASAFHALDSIFIHIQPWQDARFAGEYPTPEEFFYYKGEKLHRNFIEQSDPCIMPTVPACGTHSIFIQILLKYRKNPDFKPIFVSILENSEYFFVSPLQSSFLWYNKVYF